jgi:hypothetical protein
VHEAADGEVRQHQAVELLPHQLRGLAPQHDPGAAQVRLEFVEGRLDLPALVVQGGQLRRGGGGGVLRPTYLTPVLGW